MLDHPESFYKHRRLNLDGRVLTPLMMRRRLNMLKRWADSFKDFNLSANVTHKERYWHCKIPIMDSIVAPDASYEIRKECLQNLVNAHLNLINSKNKYNITGFSKVMCLISLPDMFSSEITVFFDKQYYKAFFKRDNDYQTWDLITDKGRSILKEYEIKVPSTVSLKEKGYIETVRDDGEEYKSELWAIGEIE